MNEGLNSRPTDGTNIVLHADDLTATLAEAQMPTWQHDRVLCHSEADDTLADHVVTASRLFLLSIHVCQVKDGPVVQKFLLDHFELI